MEVIGTTIPHSSFGDPECCGCLNGIIKDGVAEVVCNECEAVLLRLRAEELRRVLVGMECQLDLAARRMPALRHRQPISRLLRDPGLCLQEMRDGCKA
jgi:hypothetical protein